MLLHFKMVGRFGHLARMLPGNPPWGTCFRHVHLRGHPVADPVGAGKIISLGRVGYAMGSSRRRWWKFPSGASLLRPLAPHDPRTLTTKIIVGSTFSCTCLVGVSPMAANVNTLTRKPSGAEQKAEQIQLTSATGVTSSIKVVPCRVPCGVRLSNQEHLISMPFIDSLCYFNSANFRCVLSYKALPVPILHNHNKGFVFYSILF